jgi:hypothetical protein
MAREVEEIKELSKGEKERRDMIAEAEETVAREQRKEESVRGEQRGEESQAGLGGRAEKSNSVLGEQRREEPCSVRDVEQSRTNG